VVRDVAGLIAIGVLADGHRSIIGLGISLSEAEVHWGDFLQSLSNADCKAWNLSHPMTTPV